MTKRKKQQFCTILGLCAVLLVLGAGCFFAEKYKERKEAAETEEEIALYSVKEEEITELHYKNQTADLTFIKNDETWTLKEDSAFPVEQSIVQNMAEAVASVNAKQLVTKECEDLQQYELENPSLHIEITNQEGKKYSISYGMESAAAGGCYAYTDNTSVVYVVPSNVTSEFEYTKNQLMELPDTPEIDEDKVTSFVVRKSGKDIAYDKDSLEEIAGYLTDFSLTEGVSYKASEQELKQYHLKNPDYIFTVKYDTLSGEDSEKSKKTKHSYELSVGVKDEREENYYVSVKGEEGIYLMSAEIIDTLLSVKK